MLKRASAVPAIGRRNPARIIVPVTAALACLGVTAFFALHEHKTERPRIVSVPPLPGTVRVVIDTSASMAGYFGGKTEFKDFLAQLVADLPRVLQANGQKGPPIRYAMVDTASSTIVPLGKTPDELIQAILANQIPTGGSS